MKEKSMPIKNEGTSAPRASENRQSDRYPSVAGVSIHGFEGEALLSDVSLRGFRMESVTYVVLTPGERCKIQITPEDAANVISFELEVEVRWVRSAETIFAAGFYLTSPAVGNSLPQYINYLKSHNRL
jgi:hypothetical protein